MMNHDDDDFLGNYNDQQRILFPRRILFQTIQMSDEILGDSSVSYIDADILADVLKSHEHDDTNDMLVVDVRDDDFGPYYIRKAINLPSKLFDLEETKSNLLNHIKDNNKKVIIFHCMKSQVRGPTCALAFRSYIDQFEDGKEITVQVLEGGFSKWKHLFGNDNTLISRQSDYIE